MHTHTKFEIFSVDWHKNLPKILILSISKLHFICAPFSAEGVRYGRRNLEGTKPLFFVNFEGIPNSKLGIVSNESYSYLTF